MDQNGLQKTMPHIKGNEHYAPFVVKLLFWRWLYYSQYESNPFLTRFIVLLWLQELRQKKGSSMLK